MSTLSTSPIHTMVTRRDISGSRHRYYNKIFVSATDPIGSSLGESYRLASIDRKGPGQRSPLHCTCVYS
jgi:hypothetical protein